MKNRGTCGIICMMVGLLFLGGAIGLLGYNTWQEKKGEESMTRIMKEMDPIITPLKHEVDILPKTMQTVSVEGNEYIGVLEIPCIGTMFPILENLSDEQLKIAPCRYKGSYLNDTMILAGHNYREGFGIIKQLEIGDVVTFTDTIGNTIKYRVSNVEIIEGTNVEAMEEGEDWDLTLFSCTYGGQERYTVRCTRVASK